MRTFAEKQHQPQQISSTNFTRPNSAVPALSHEAHPLLEAQRTIGNQALLRSLQPARSADAIRTRDNEALEVATIKSPVEESIGRMPASELSIGPGAGSPATPAPAPSAPGWLGKWRSSAVHVQGDIWDVRLPTLGQSWVGPYDQLQAYINKQGFGGKLEAAHIVGGEHLSDLGSAFTYEKAPCIAVDKSLHATWTTQTSNLQSREGPMGGRGSRADVSPGDVIGLYDSLYRGHPELQAMSRNIVNLPGKDPTGHLMPKPTSTMPAPTSPIPKPTPTMPEPKSTMPKRTSTMPKRTSTMPKPTSTMPKPTPTMPKPTPTMPKPTSTMPKWTSTMPAVGAEPVTLGGVSLATVKSLAVGTLVTTIVMSGLQLVVAWLTYEKNVESAEERRLKQLFGEKVTPAVDEALKLHAREAEQMTNNHPEFPVYANVTLEIEESWTESGIAGNPSGRSITDARFIDLDVSFTKVSKEKTISKESSWSTHYATKRVTYSVEIDFGETPAEHQQRRLRHHAAQIAQQKLSARSVAEGSHWSGIDLTPREKAQDAERRKWGMPTLAEQREYDERDLWVQAYIEYTAFYGPDDQYVDAVRYLEEIRRRPRPIPGEPLRMK